MLAIILSLVLFSVGGCLPFRSAGNPMPTLALSPANVAGSRIYILLPGMLDKPETFARKGIADIINRIDPQAGIVAADAHFNYYRKQILLERLLEDVIEPARSQGYEEIWLVGVSLGGFGSVLFASLHPDLITGVLLMAPFLGEEDDLKQVDELKSQFNPDAPGDLKPKIRALITAWNWLDEEAPDPTSHPRIILAYGKDDRLLAGIQRLAGKLPQEDVFSIPGGHDWETWGSLLEQALPRLQQKP